jgi:hypothetical protein
MVLHPASKAMEANDSSKVFVDTFFSAEANESPTGSPLP